MINYLAIDFGTSNCVAGLLERTPLGMKLRLVKLENESYLLPSVLFIQQRNLPPLEVSETLLLVRLAAEELREEQRLVELERQVRAMVESYERFNSPRVRAPEPGDYYSREAFDRANKKYRSDLAALPIAQQRFKDTELKEYERELRMQMIRPRSAEQIKKAVKYNLARNVSEDRSKLLWDKTFFGALMSDDMQTFFGDAAIKEYSADPMSGFLMRSPKAFLAADIQEQHREIFIRALTKIFRRIKEAAETDTGESFNGAVFGRPVNFMGAGDEIGNSRAVSIIKEASRRAGFVEIRFVLEPLAAALAIRRKVLDTDDPVLVVDIGGGTTDVAYLQVARDSEQNFFVRNVFGERLGGNDLDQAIAWSYISPYIGRGATFKDGKPIPTTVISAALQTRDIHQQVSFRRAFPVIEHMMQHVSNGDSDKIDRLYEVLLGQLQHRLMLSAESIKIRSDSINVQSIDFDYFEVPFSISFDSQSVVTTAESCLGGIAAIVRSSISASDDPERPVRVFLTGGVSQHSMVRDSIKQVLPTGSSIDTMPALKSIIGGLSIVSNALNSASSLLLEPDLVRGVSVIR